MTILLDISLPRTLAEWVCEFRLAPAAGSRVEAWLFEGADARRRAERRLARAGIDARFFSAYKPLVFHFLEQVDTAGLRAVTVRYPVHAQAPARRFALEAYPLAEMLGDGVDVRLLPQDAHTTVPVYRVDLAWHDGRQRTDDVFAPNRLHADPLGATLLSPTAWVRRHHADGSVDDLPRECDAQALFRQAVDCIRSHAWPAEEPYFERLDLRVDLPGIHHAPPAETGWIDSHEALHEDLYFSAMEIFQQRSGRGPGDRRLQPGQIVPDVRRAAGRVRLRIAAVPYPALPPAEPADAEDDQAADLAGARSPLSPARIAQALAAVDGTPFFATTRQGRAVRGVYRAGRGPAVVVSGGQHANETSGIVGALRAAQVLAALPDAHFALIPLENPDGYALHRELRRQAPRHMHHAARYTALGDDLEYRDTAPWYEAAARRQAFALTNALLHVNLHGYPAHEWTRPCSGYLPRGFEMWTVPKGFFLIVRHHAGWADAARRLAEHICRRLAQRPELMAYNARQQAGYTAHAGDIGFEILHGTACLVAAVAADPARPAPPLTVVTEFPDETVYGDAFVLAHDTQAAAVLAAVEGLALLEPPRAVSATAPAAGDS